MKALILRTDPGAALASSRALIDKGFQILCVDRREVAETLVRMDTIDLLVMDEEVAGQLTHTIALSGERKNPYISSIMMTDRSGAETDDLYDLIPSLYALAGAQTAPALLGKLALAAVINTEEVQARVARNAAADLAYETASEELILLDTVETPWDVTEAEDDLDIPSYADVIFATPALAELEYSKPYEDKDVLFGSARPSLQAIFAKRPLVLTDLVREALPA
jgi:hypothetical protein